MNFLITTNADCKNDFDLNEITHKNFRIFFDDNWTRKENRITKTFSQYLGFMQLSLDCFSKWISRIYKVDY